MGGTSTCEAVDFTCGTAPPSCPSPTLTGPGFPLPLETSEVNVDPGDVRWAELYQACLAGGGTCGEACRGFCQTALRANLPSLPGGASVYKCDVVCGSPNKLTATYTTAVCGRRFKSSRCGGQRRSAGGLLGRYLAEAAELEAESVPAFARLVRGLTAYAAPDELVRAARTATIEEGRHWRHTRDVARRYGGRPVKAVVSRTLFASLADLAVDNVIEGCVRETYGAMVAAHQATEAGEPEVRRLMTDIAVDEIGHAALSWKIDAWARGRLGPEFEARRRDAALVAASELIAGARLPVAEQLQTAAGLPSPATAQALLAATCAFVWGPNAARPLG